MRPGNVARGQAISEALQEYSFKYQRLPGICPPDKLRCLVEQIVESQRRVEYLHHIANSRHDHRRSDPSSELFDPLKAAVLAMQAGDTDESYWLAFIATHFGKHRHDKWRLARDVYGGLGSYRWSWQTISQDPQAFVSWLKGMESVFRRDGVRRRFNSHRKYQSISRIGDVFTSYINWVGPPGHHAKLITVHKLVGQDPRAVFAYYYKSMDVVQQFGRLGKFDYLCNLAGLGIAPFSPNSAYIRDATGPLMGARLLFQGDAQNNTGDKELDRWLDELDKQLGFGFRVLEDALCNWQKSPHTFIPFRG